MMLGAAGTGTTIIMKTEFLPAPNPLCGAAEAG